MLLPIHTLNFFLAGSRMQKIIHLILILSVCIFVTSKKTAKSEVAAVTDIKDWKKVLRTNPNVLSIFYKVINFTIE